jgi:hypothetical protein
VLGDTEQRDVVNQLLAKVASLQNAAAAAEAKRRQLHNELVELRGNVSEAAGCGALMQHPAPCCGHGS